jgi:hypothetical protein
MRDAATTAAGAGAPRRPRFLPPPTVEPRAFVIVRRAAAVVVALFLALGAMSSYRAYVQVWRLDLRADSVLRAGSPVRADVVSSGRARASVLLELVQGARVETVGTLRIRGNDDGFLDPRPRRGTLSATVEQALLSHLEPGRATLRATARGTRQWLREPTPVVRELDVRIERASAVP